MRVREDVPSKHEPRLRVPAPGRSVESFSAPGVGEDLKRITDYSTPSPPGEPSRDPSLAQCPGRSTFLGEVRGTSRAWVE